MTARGQTTASRDGVETGAVPWAEIDDGIAPVVGVLADAGLEPFASCQGGEGHAFDRPTVRVRAGGSLRRARRIARKALHDAGYHGFTVSERRMYQRGRRPWSAYVEVEMWEAPDGAGDDPADADLIGELIAELTNEDFRWLTVLKAYRDGFSDEATVRGAFEARGLALADGVVDAIIAGLNNPPARGEDLGMTPEQVESVGRTIRALRRPRLGRFA